jgi:hypothetical protein
MTTVRSRQSSPNDYRALADMELSRMARLGQLTILVASVMMTSVIGLLGVTEPSLPVQARIVFAMMGVIGLCSSAFVLRASSHRRALLARDRVIACRTAVALAATIVLVASIIGLAKGIPSAFAIAGFGVLLLGGAVALLRQENRKLSALTARRRALELQLKGGG